MQSWTGPAHLAAVVARSPLGGRERERLSLLLPPLLLHVSSARFDKCTLASSCRNDNTCTWPRGLNYVVNFNLTASPNQHRTFLLYSSVVVVVSSHNFEQRRSRFAVLNSRAAAGGRD